MAPVDGEALADLWREADPETVAAFVADLYAARGYDVERPEEGLLRLQPGGRTLAVRPTDAEDHPDVDAVVTVNPGTVTDPDTDVVDADALADQLAYALDRSVARGLLERHFGVDVGPASAGGQGTPVAAGGKSARDGPTPDSAGDSSGDGGGGTSVNPRSWRQRGLAAVVAAAGLLLLIGVLAGGASVLSPGVGATDDATSAATPSPTPAETPTPSVDRNGAAIAAGKRAAERTPQHSIDEAYSQLTDQPPGVDEDGLADIDTLIAAHRSVLSNTSFTVTVQYREFEGGRVTGTFLETVRVENASRYSVSVSETGTLQTSPRALVGADAFSTGNLTWVRSRSDEAYVRSRLSTSRMLGQLARYLRWSLSVEESTLRGRPSGDDGTYRITTDGDPYQGIRDASGTAYVTGEGVVTYGRWTYTTVRTETRVEFSVRTTDIGTTTVSRPGWVGETNATD